IKAQCQHEAAIAASIREDDAADPAQRIAKGRGRLARPWRWAVQTLEVLRARERPCLFRLIEGKVFGRTAIGEIAAAASEARDGDSFGNMFAIVPFDKVASRFGKDVVPDRDDGISQETHRHSLSFAR